MIDIDGYHMIFIDAIASKTSRRQIKRVSSLNKYLLSIKQLETQIIIHMQLEHTTNVVKQEEKKDFKVIP